MKKLDANSTAVYESVDALAKEIGISRQSTHVALRNGLIPHIRIGKRFVLPRAAIQEWLRGSGGRPESAR